MVLVTLIYILILILILITNNVHAFVGVTYHQLLAVVRGGAHFVCVFLILEIFLSFSYWKYLYLTQDPFSDENLFGS